MQLHRFDFGSNFRVVHHQAQALRAQRRRPGFKPGVKAVDKFHFANDIYISPKGFQLFGDAFDQEWLGSVLAALPAPQYDH